MPSLTAAQQRIHRAALELFAGRTSVPVNVRELAEAAGVARGTIYNNLADPDTLFEEVAAQLSGDMNERVARSFGDIQDPALRLAMGIRFYTRRTHEEPHWGRFLCRFAFNNATLQQLWGGQALQDVVTGQESGRYRFRSEQLPSVITMIAGASLGAIFLVLEGHKTWREAGSDAAELVLVALGIAAEEAQSIARSELPDLAASGEGA